MSGLNCGSVVVALCMFGVYASANEGYKNYTYVLVNSDGKLENYVKIQDEVDRLTNDSDQVHVLGYSRTSAEVHVVVAPKHRAKLLNFFDRQRFDYLIVSDDYGGWTDGDGEPQAESWWDRTFQSAKKYLLNIFNGEEADREDSAAGVMSQSIEDIKNVDGNFHPRKYNSYDVIQRYQRQLLSKYPNLVAVEEIGRTYEGRPVTLVRLSANLSASTGNASKPVIGILGGVHAREWLAMHSVLRVVTSMLEGYNTWSAAEEGSLPPPDADHRDRVPWAARDMLRDFEWHFVPLVNPDGYAYSMEKDRSWRKNRQPYPGRINCVGVDLNRNYPPFWRATPSECDHNTFPGDSAASEMETQAITNHFEKETDRVIAFMDIHGFTEGIMVPYAHACGARAAKFDQMIGIAKKMASAISAVRGAQYAVGHTCEVISYTAAGVTDDWALSSLRGWPGQGGLQWAGAVEVAPSMPTCLVQRCLPVAREGIEQIFGEDTLDESGSSSLLNIFTGDQRRSKNDKSLARGIVNKLERGFDNHIIHFAAKREQDVYSGPSNHIENIRNVEQQQQKQQRKKSGSDLKVYMGPRHCVNSCFQAHSHMIDLVGMEMFNALSTLSSLLEYQPLTGLV